MRQIIRHHSRRREINTGESTPRKSILYLYEAMLMAPYYRPVNYDGVVNTYFSVFLSPHERCIRRSWLRDAMPCRALISFILKWCAVNISSTIHYFSSEASLIIVTWWSIAHSSQKYRLFSRNAYWNCSRLSSAVRARSYRRASFGAITFRRRRKWADATLLAEAE